MDPQTAAIPLYQPGTFAERGVSVPFTTQALLGARARIDPRRGLELVVPNPAGGRGVYVLAWAGVREICHPTVHDTHLHNLVAPAESVTPQSVRAAARDIALQGSAGRPARAAALQAQRAEAESQQATYQDLLTALTNAPETADIAAALAHLGVGPLAGGAAYPIRLARLQGFRDAMAECARLHDGEPGKLAASLHMLADVAVRSTAAVLAEVRPGASGAQELLTAWRAGPDRVAQAAARPGWLLDGWDLPCLLWQGAPADADRAATLHEIAHVTPLLPKEAGQWSSVVIDLDAAQTLRRAVALNQDWRTGMAALDLVARNEQLLALAA